ncbi:MAG TPA: hypothetical protein VHG52_00840 [Thermomicrobiales bacterium]|nr:hypothetical protein [Thermomicrobiales bacterium]
MKTFAIAITTMCLIASPLVATSAARAAAPIGPDPVLARSQTVITPGGATFQVTKLRGGKVLLKRFQGGTRVSVVVDPPGSTVTYKWGWIGPILDRLFGPTFPMKNATCMRSTTTVKTKDGTEIKTTQETGNCPKQ